MYEHVQVQDAFRVQRVLESNHILKNSGVLSFTRKISLSLPSVCSTTALFVSLQSTQPSPAAFAIFTVEAETEGDGEGEGD